MKNWTFIFFVLLSLAPHVFLLGQGSAVQVNPIKSSVNNPLFADVWLYATGSRQGYSNMWTANNSSFHPSQTLYGTYFDVSLMLELQKKKTVLHFPVRFGVGYKYERFAYKNDKALNSGLFAHWLSTTFEYFNFVVLGLRADFLLDGNLNSVDHYSYVGLYPSCLNKVALQWYIGLSLPIRFVNLHARMGSYILPPFDPNRVAYVNQGRAYVRSFFWEAGIGFRIFSMRSRM